MKRLPMRGPLPPAVKDRPRCGACDAPLRPLIFTVFEPRTSEDGYLYHDAVAREWTGRYNGPRHFCSNPCAIAFAQACYARGARRATK